MATTSADNPAAESGIYIENISHTRENTYRALAANGLSRLPILPHEEIWNQMSQIPPVPNPMLIPNAGPIGAAPVELIEMQLRPVAGSALKWEQDAFQPSTLPPTPVGASGSLVRVIPANFGNPGAYYPKLAGLPAYDGNTWIVDGIHRYVEFPYGSPLGFTSINMQFYRYTGTTGGGTISADVTTLTSAGGVGTTSLVSDGNGPYLAVKGLTAGAGTGITLTESATEVTIEYDDARLLAVEGKTKNIDIVSLGSTSFNGIVSVRPDDPEPLVASGEFVADSSTTIQSVGGARFTTVADSIISAVGVPVVHWPDENTATTRRFNIWTNSGFLVAGFDLPKTKEVLGYYVLDVEVFLVAGTYRYAIDRGINVPDIQFGDGDFTFNPRVSNIKGAIGNGGNVFPGTLGGENRPHTGMIFFSDGVAGIIEAKILKGLEGDPVMLGSDLDFGNNYNLLGCISINGNQPSGGVYSQSSGARLSGTQAKTNLIGAGYGSVDVPANSWKPGDSYALKIGGLITCSSGNTFSITVSTEGDAPSTFVTFQIVIEDGLDLGWWELEVEFIIRAIGGAGSASVVTNGKFSYVAPLTRIFKGSGASSTQSSTFDTTVPNTLRVDYGTNDATITVFEPLQLVLKKIF